jgi:hypothetical protein
MTFYISTDTFVYYFFFTINFFLPFIISLLLVFIFFIFKFSYENLLISKIVLFLIFLEIFFNFFLYSIFLEFGSFNFFFGDFFV